MTNVAKPAGVYYWYDESKELSQVFSLSGAVEDASGQEIIATDFAWNVASYFAPKGHSDYVSCNTPEKLEIVASPAEPQAVEVLEPAAA